MADREKVIKGLECCASMNGSACRECPYSSECVVGEASYQTGTAHLAADALALLKEQEPKTGHWIDSARDDKCSVCRATYSVLYPDYHHTHYCPNRGAKMIVQAVEYSDASNEGVKWE